MCKKIFQGLFGGGPKAPKPPATARAGGDEGQEALVLADEAITSDPVDPSGGRVRLSGRGRRGGDRVAGLSI